MKDKISDYYNQNPEVEWNRLTETFYRKIEYEVVMHYLQKYLPPAGKIADLGGGPGRFSLELARRGYQVTLIDLSEGNIQFARQKISTEGLSGHFDGCFTGDESLLKNYSNNVFDAVLCMGPMYHLLCVEERLFCMRECARVVKNQGILFVTGYPRASYVRDSIRSGDFVRIACHHPDTLEDIIRNGFSIKSGYVGTYFCGLEEFRGWFEAASLAIEEIVSTNGLASFLNERVDEIGRSKEAWNTLLKMIIDTANDPQALSHAEYWLGIGRKKG